MLRTAVAWKSQRRPLQIVFPRATLQWSRLNWQHLPPVRSDEEFLIYLERDRLAPFNLSQAPLMRGALIQLANGRTRFVWTYHHIILDAWSSSLLLKEAGEAYRAFRGGVSPPLQLGPHYRTYADSLAQRDDQCAEAFWRALLAGCSLDTSLLRPVPHAHEPAPRYRYESLTKRLDTAKTVQVKRTSRDLTVTMPTLVQAAWSVVVARWTGHRDLLLGVTMSDRPTVTPAIERLVGLCINTLPVRIRTKSEQTVKDWLQEIQLVNVEARDFGHVSLTQLHAWSGLVLGEALFETVFVFENLPDELSSSEERSELAITDMRSEWYTHYPLTAMIVPGAELLLQIRFNLRRIDERTVGRLLDALSDALLALCDGPDQLVGDILNRLPRPLSPVLSGPVCNLSPAVPQVILERSVACPDRTALIAGERVFSYLELGTLIRRVAGGLRMAGVKPGDAVAVCLERSERLVSALVAILAVGSSYVALDFSLPAARRNDYVQRSGARWFLTQAVQSGFEGRGGARLLDFADLVGSAPVDSLLPQAFPTPDPDQPAYMIFTSGSTGQPHCVVVPHRALSNLVHALAQTLGFTQQDRMFAVTSLVFDIAAAELLLPLVAGGSIFLFAGRLGEDVHRGLKEFTKSGATVLQATPAVWRLLLSSGWTGHPHLKLWSGGEPLTSDLAAALSKQGRELWNLYGPTETTVWSLAHRVLANELEIPVGLPIANTVVAVLDKHGECVSLGLEGEICIGGAGLALGYHGDAELSKGRFITKWLGGRPRRLFRTGDRGRIRADGLVECLGRRDEQLKIRGTRVEPAEIETVLRGYPSIRDAAVVGYRRSGAEETELAGFIVSRADDSALDQSALIAYLTKVLPHSMIPSKFKIRPNLPLTAGGKIDRVGLQEAAMGDGKDEPAESLAPGTPVVEILEQILRDVLNQPVATRGDDFLALGGHSLLASRLIARVNYTFGTNLPLRAVFERRTAQGIAVLVEEEIDRGREARPLLQKSSAAGRAPLTDAQHRLLYLDRLERTCSPYVLHAAVELEGSLDCAALSIAIDLLVARHAILRSRFCHDAEGGTRRSFAPFRFR